jgi:hypothetical protein
LTIETNSSVFGPHPPDPIARGFNIAKCNADNDPPNLTTHPYFHLKKNMEVEIFTLADFAQDNNSKLTIVGTFDSIHTKQFPCIHPHCTVATRLRFSAKEVGKHDFRLRLVDADDQELIKPVEGTINIASPVNGQLATINIVANFGQLKFEKPGRYSFELYIDGEWESGLPLFLNKLSQ